MLRRLLGVLAVLAVLSSVSTGLQPAISEAATGLTRWPYLQNVTSAGATIAWVTSTGGAGEVRYSTDQSYGQIASATTRAVGGQYYAVAALTGLQPGTRYYYRIRTAGVDLTPWTTASFATAPTGNNFTFAALGDSRDGSPAAVSVADQMARWSFDLVLHDGDLVTDGLASQYDPQVFSIYRALMGKVPFFTALGNHEYNGDGYQAYLNDFYPPQNGPAGLLGRAYSFDWGNAHFTVLDTNVGYAPGSAQYVWLQNDLASTRQTWKFVLDHHPPYSSGAEHGSDLNVRNTLGPLFDQYGVDIMFSGHDHDYERSLPMVGGQIAAAGQKGVTYIVTGGGGAPLYAVGRSSFTAAAFTVNHFTRTIVQDCTLTMQAIDTGGSVFDSLTLNKCSGATPTPTPTSTPDEATPTSAPTAATPMATPGEATWTPAPTLPPGRIKDRLDLPLIIRN